MTEGKLTPSKAALWRSIGQYTAAEAAWLLMDEAPQTTWIMGAYGTNTGTKGPALAMAFQVRDRFHLSDDPRVRRQRITLAELHLFAEERGLKPMILCDPEPVDADSMQWPYPHDTRLLKAVRWVIETYSGQPEWPTRELVVDKLQDSDVLGFKLGANEAKAVDTVTRPDAIRGR